MTSQGERRFRAGLVQLRSGRSIAPNLDKAEALIRRAAKGGAHYVQTPENTGIMELKPELVLAAAQSEGKSVPLAWARALVRARAIETGAFVLAATQGGLHENGRSTFGHSVIVSPWGEVLAEAGEEPGLIFADIDLAASEEARARIPVIKHAREFEVEIAG